MKRSSDKVDEKKEIEEEVLKKGRMSKRNQEREKRRVTAPSNHNLHK